MNIKKERNYGIDLLRILAMLFIVILHSYGRGGILYNTIENTSQYKFAWLIEIIAYCAVDVFALISGYVCYKENNNKINISRYFNLWLQVVFYGLLINIAFNIYDPSLVSKTNYLKVLFPVSNNLYWYFTAYTGLFFLMPFINNGIKNTDNKMLKKIFIIIFLLFSLYGTFFNIFSFERGYSFVWILILYILGAIIKKCEIGKNLNKMFIIIGIVILTAITYFYKMYGIQYGDITKDLFINYCSPTILGISILYLIYFSKLKFNSITKKIVSFASISSFSIYLINNHELVWNSIDLLFRDLAVGRVRYLIIEPIGFSLLFVVGSIIVDKFRIIIFKLLHIDSFCDLLDNKLDSLLDKITK